LQCDTKELSVEQIKAIGGHYAQVLAELSREPDGRIVHPEGYQGPIYLESLSLTPNGKADRNALSVPVRTAQSSVGYVAPQSELEQRLSQIWQGVLKLAQVGIYDNFFDLGGDSLLLMRVYSKLQASLSYEVPMVDLFHYPTIHALSAHLSAQQEQQTLLQPVVERAQKRKEALQQPKPTRARNER
jgi:acyl carrier protein